jgi:pSer/pThr/pTyr-binding forkhead associated (FHA) protein
VIHAQALAALLALGHAQLLAGHDVEAYASGARLSRDNGDVSATPPAGADASAEARELAEAESSGAPFLLFRDRDGAQRLFFLAPGSDSASVGRRQSSDLLLDWDEEVSRLHARFERVGDGWELVDDGFSSNGTYVNEERLSGRRRLNDGDTVRFGSTNMTFRTPGEERDDPRSSRGRERPEGGGPVLSEAAKGLSTSQRRVLAALCRPYKGQATFAIPATDQEIADELVLSVGVVRAQLKVLCAKLGVDGAAHGDVRVRLVERAFASGVVSDRDL